MKDKNNSFRLLKVNEKILIGHLSVEGKVKGKILKSEKDGTVVINSETPLGDASLLDPIIIRSCESKDLHIFTCDIIEKLSQNEFKIKAVDSIHFIERRHHNRYPVSAKAVATDSSSANFVMIKNISLTGMCIYSSDVLSEEKEFDINILISESETIELMGRVVWNKTRDVESFTLQFEYGIAFNQSISEISMKKLKKYLNIIKIL